ncbi:glycosyltransferase [Caldisericum sp.]|uniref:glycosyltransferase n=1 Tax=Caldisericum sp. TaxID=2499687 RepID=UPI003D102B10
MFKRTFNLFHLYKIKRILKRSGLFDQSYYLKMYPDVRQADIDPITHYLLHGYKEGRNPHLLFNTQYYLNAYPDVAKSGMNPLLHYILHGAYEGRWPSEEFDSSYYLNSYPDVKKAGINPLLHYALYGKKEGRKPKSPTVISQTHITKLIDYSDLLSVWKKIFNDRPVIPHFNTKYPIDIIIPIFNGMEYLPMLFDSIIKNTLLPFRLLIIDDNSSDPNVQTFLKKIQTSYPNLLMKILINEKNLGFVKSVNKAVSYVKNHFVILNTDVLVPPFWLERLMYPIFNMKNIASTTPLTNAGTICSFPKFLENNPVFENLNIEKLDSYFSYINFDKNYVEVPTGVGFCIGINFKVVKKIGMFDEAFGRGYGEENDWCMRAIEHGYKNIIVPNLFVYHKHGGSFNSEEKNFLNNENSKYLAKKHPTYFEKVEKFIKEDKLADLRNISITWIASSYDESNRPIFIIDHSWGGGANLYTDQLIKKYQKENKKIFLLSYELSSKQFILNFIYKDYKLAYSLSSLEKDVFTLLCKEFSVKEIIVNELVTYPNPLEILRLILETKREFNTKLSIAIHDYFCICPSYNLLNYKVEYCGIPDKNLCAVCLKANKFIKEAVSYLTNEIEAGTLTIHKWREEWGKLLNGTDNIIVFSNSSKNILLKAYPEFKKEKITINPHNVDWINSIERTDNLKNLEEKIIIGVLGKISLHKGAQIIREMEEIIKAYNIKARIVIIGEYENQSTSNVISVTGEYKKEDIVSYLNQYAIDIIFIPSICPETFSFTTREAILSGLPVATFNLGAQAEQVKNYRKGIIIEETSGRAALKKILDHFHRKEANILTDIIKKKIQIVSVVNDYTIFNDFIKYNPFMNKYAIFIYDNVENNIPITQRYNNFIETNMQLDSWIVFCHQDFAFLENVEEKINNLDKNFIYGVIGAVWEDGSIKLYGQINQGYNGKWIKHGEFIDTPKIVDTIDCQCIIVHESLITRYKLRFDENLSFHQYAEDFCLNAKYNHGILTKAVQFECKHLSFGKLSDSFYNSINYVHKKYSNKKFAGTCTVVERPIKVKETF